MKTLYESVNVNQEDVIQCQDPQWTKCKCTVTKMPQCILPLTWACIKTMMCLVWAPYRLILAFCMKLVLDKGQGDISSNFNHVNLVER